MIKTSAKTRIMTQCSIRTGVCLMVISLLFGSAFEAFSQESTINHNLQLEASIFSGYYHSYGVKYGIEYPLSSKMHVSMNLGYGFNYAFGEAPQPYSRSGYSIPLHGQIEFGRKLRGFVSVGGVYIRNFHPSTQSEIDLFAENLGTYRSTYESDRPTFENDWLLECNLGGKILFFNRLNVSGQLGLGFQRAGGGRFGIAQIPIRIGVGYYLFKPGR